MAVILVADDEETIRVLVHVVLTSSGHHVLSAGNGLEAVALFRSYASRIDIVITDLIMPVMDGYQLMRIVKSDRPQTKIICMTGYSNSEIPPDTILLPKPFLPDQLREVVNRICCDPVT